VYEKTNATFKEDENYLVQKTSIYCSNRNDTQETSGNDSYLLIDTANNENKYIIWFNQGISPLAPSISGYTNIEVDLSSLASGDNVAPKIVETLDAVTSLEGFTYTLNGERIIFENTSPGVSLGVR